MSGTRNNLRSAVRGAKRQWPLVREFQEDFRRYRRTSAQLADWNVQGAVSEVVIPGPVTTGSPISAEVEQA